MPDAPHRIRRQRWVVRAGSTAEAFAWRRFLCDHGQDLLLPLLEKAFDEAAGDRILHVAKLEVKIRTDSHEHLPEALAAAVVEHLKAQLSIARDGEERSDGRPVREGESGSTGRSRRVDVLLHYLRTGSLPWAWTHVPPSESSAVLISTCLEKWDDWVDHRPPDSESSSFYFRLLQIMPAELRPSWLESHLGEMPQEFRSAMIAVVTDLLGSSDYAFKPYARLRLAAGLVSEITRRQARSITPELVSTVLDVSAVTAEESRTFLDLVGRATADVAHRAGGEGLDAAPESGEGSQLRDSRADGRGRAPFFAAAFGGEDALQRAGDRPAPGDDGPASFPRKDDGDVPGSPSQDLFPLLVLQAGLVLLHPFIVRFFEHTGLLEKEGNRIPAAFLPRAAALLHFLASGGGDVYEYELGFIKVLLGLSPATQLPVCRGLVKDADKEEVEGLLRSVIGYWSSLKSTSVHGLRASFLQRQGLLREDENGWRLNVERKPFDMLLEQLPWSIGMVRLPWMKKPLHTEW